MDPVPKKKPITREKFEEKVDLYMQGLFGGMGKELMLPLLNKVYQEAKDAGVVTPEEAYKYAQDKSNYYKDLNMRQQMRAPFKKGGNYNPSGKNQYTPKTLEQVLETLKDPKYSDYRKSDFYKKKIIGRKTLNKYEKENPGLIKYPAYGKRSDPKKTRSTQNLKQSKFIKGAQGSSISMDKINNFGHFAPKLKTFLTSTANTGPIKGSVNRYAEGYDKAVRNIALKQEKLITEKPKNWKKLLIRENYKAANLSKRANKELPKGLKGTLGYFTVDPKSGEFKLKGVDKAKTFAGLSGEEKFYKTDMTTAERKKFGEKQAKIQKLIDKNPDLKRATSIKGGGDRVRLKPVGISPFRKLRYMSKGGPVKYGKYAKQISKLSS